MNPRSPAFDEPKPRNAADAVPKLCGCDVELANFITTDSSMEAGGSAEFAAVLLLRQFDGFSRQPAESAPSSSAHSLYESSAPAYGGQTPEEGRQYRPNAQDWGRKFLPANGGCAYIDLHHLEICTPECVSAFTHVAAFQAMLQLTRQAMERANGHLPPGRRIRVLANNTDGTNSWGGHLNFLMTRRAYENIFDRKLQYLLFLASHQVSSIILTGAGAVGSASAQPETDYRISARGDFYQMLVGPQTTFKRPLVNSRDEALAGLRSWDEDRRLARLHVIFFDTNLCPVANLLKVGLMQVVLAMIEQDAVPTSLILDDPLKALVRWSHDPGLSASARLVSGEAFTALDHAQAVFEAAERFVSQGRADGLVPRVAEIMSLWGRALDQLCRRDVQALVGCCDWITKRFLLERAMEAHGLDWQSPQVRVLDQLYASLDEDGLHSALASSGIVQQVAGEEEVRGLTAEPPDDTRAWLRAQILRRAEDGTLDDVDWDRICLRAGGEFRDGSWNTGRFLWMEMSNPLAFTRRQCERILDEAPSLMEALRRLAGRRDGSGADETGIVPASGSDR